MRVYHLWTTIELEDTDDDYFEELDVPVSIGHFRTYYITGVLDIEIAENEKNMNKIFNRSLIDFGYENKI